MATVAADARVVIRLVILIISLNLFQNLISAAALYGRPEHTPLRAVGSGSNHQVSHGRGCGAKRLQDYRRVSRTLSTLLKRAPPA